MPDLHLEAELERITQQGVARGILQARLAIARWLLELKTSDYLSKDEMALRVLSMPITEVSETDQAS